MGVDAPDPSTARVLDIGCGDGGNLVPMAAALPRRELRRHRPVAARDRRGARVRARSRLVQRQFHAADLRDLPADAGTLRLRRRARLLLVGARAGARVAVRDAPRAPRAARRRVRQPQRAARLRAAPHRVGRAETARRGIEDPVARIAEARAMAAHMADAMAKQPGLAAGARDRVPRDRRSAGLRGAARRPRADQPSGSRCATSWPRRARTGSPGSATPTSSATRRLPSASR